MCKGMKENRETREAKENVDKIDNIYNSDNMDNMDNMDNIETKDNMDNMQAITNIENKYGSVLFRMGLIQLFDVGHRNFGDNEAKEYAKQILAQAETDKANGKKSIMSPNFQCEIVRCAAELSRFSPWTLFTYIKKHLVVN